MRAYGLLIILCAFLPPASSAFQGISFWAKALPEFVRTLGGTATSNEVARSTAVDSQGNIYITGSYQNSSANGNSTTDFDDGTLLGLGGAPSADVFLAKLDPGGKQLWIRTLGGANSSDIGYSVAVDTSGNVYVAGTYINSTSNATSAVDFAGNTLLGMSTLNNTDGFVAKLDSSGSQQWIKTLGGTSTDGAYSVDVDSSGNVYVIGVFANTSANAASVKDFSNVNLIGVGGTTNNHVFVAKLNSSGTQQWIRKLGGNSIDYGYGLAADASGNVYVTGVYLNSSGDSQTATDFAGATLLGKAAAQTYDTFVAKLNTSGTQQWIRTLGGTSQDNGYAVDVDSSGNVYVTGYYTNTTANANAVTSFSGAALNGKTTTASQDIFVAKLNSSGTQQWIRTLGGTSNVEYGQTVTVDNSNGNVFIVGNYTNTSANANTVTDFAGSALNGKGAAVSDDAFVAKLNSSGTQQWIKTLGGAAADSAYGVAVDIRGFIYVSGVYNNDSADVRVVTDFANATLLGKTATASPYAFLFKIRPP